MEKNNMGGFRSYMTTMLPGYESFLDKEQIDSLFELYREWEKHDRIASNCLHKQLNPSHIVDYAVDFEKQMDIAAQKGNALKNAIKSIKIVYGLDNKEVSLSEKKCI